MWRYTKNNNSQGKKISKTLASEPISKYVQRF